MPSPIRLNPALIAAAEKDSVIQKRSVPKQIEYWVELGRAVEGVLDLADVFAVIQGFKQIKVEEATSATVDSNDVFDSLEVRRDSGSLAEGVTTSTVYYEASSSCAGLLDKVDSTTGERQTGQFYNGEFKVQG
ncbi:MAG: hypothetical protein GY866_43645 [Proteobacteria bacterium]|nr:hypothetical protein [Pseudomonadota bacterium]